MRPIAFSSGARACDRSASPVVDRRPLFASAYSSACGYPSTWTHTFCLCLLLPVFFI